MVKYYIRLKNQWITERVPDKWGLDELSWLCLWGNNSLYFWYSVKICTNELYQGVSFLVIFISEFCVKIVIDVYSLISITLSISPLFSITQNEVVSFGLVSEYLDAFEVHHFRPYRKSFAVSSTHINVLVIASHTKNKAWKCLTNCFPQVLSLFFVRIFCAIRYPCNTIISSYKENWDSYEQISTYQLLQWHWSWCYF